MMTTVRLLGRAEVLVGGRWLSLPADKRGALLAYLAFEGAWVARERLAFLFWPDTSDANARRNLRQLLSRVKAIEAAADLAIEPDRVGWFVATDVDAFRQAMAAQAWQAAIDLYASGLCPGLSVPAAAGFESWLALERQQLADAYAEAVHHRAEQLEGEGAFDEAAALLRGLLERDSLAEDVVQRYLRAAYLAGRRDEALQAYQAFCRRLDAELGLEPLEATEQLAATLRQAAPSSPRTSSPRTLSPRTPPEQAAAGSSVIPLTVLRPPRLIGREAAVAAIRQMNTPAVFVAGEAGVGKSRLMAEFAPEALTLRCQEGLREVPYHPLVALVRRLLHEGVTTPPLGPYQEDLARLVSELTPGSSPGPAEPESAKGRLLEAIARYLEGVVAARTHESDQDGDHDRDFDLIFDDLQWADAGTLELLVFLCHRGNLRMLGAYRMHELAAEQQRVLGGLVSQQLAHYVELEPLGAAATQELLASLMDASAGPELFGRWLHERTGGNPMFALEALKSLFEAGDLRADTRGWHSHIDALTRDYRELSIPKAVAELVQRRVSRLSELARRALYAAAVLQVGFSPKTLGRLVGVSEWALLEVFEELEGTGFVRGQQFGHDLIRQGIYQGLAEAQRQILHGTIATILEDELEAQQVAEHYLRAGQVEKAVTHWRRAAEQLAGRGLFDASLAALQQCLEYVRDEGERTTLELALLRHELDAGRLDAAAQRLAALDDRPLEPHLAAQRSIHRVRLLFAQGHKESAKAVVDAEFPGFADVPDPELQRELRWIEGTVEFELGAYREVLELLEPDLARLEREGSSVLLADYLSSFGSLYDHLGEHETALGYHRRAYRMAKALDARSIQVICMQNMIFCLVCLGRVEEGLDDAEEALSFGHFARSDVLRNNLAAAYMRLQRYHDAARHAQLLTESAVPAWQAAAYARLAEANAALQQPQAAAEALKHAIAIARTLEDDFTKALVCLAVVAHGHAEQLSALRSVMDSVTPAHLYPELRARFQDAVQRVAAPSPGKGDR